MESEYFLCLKDIWTIGGFHYEIGKIYKFVNRTYPIHTWEILRPLCNAEVVIALGTGKEIIDMDVSAAKEPTYVTKWRNYGLSL